MTKNEIMQQLTAAGIARIKRFVCDPAYNKEAAASMGVTAKEYKNLSTACLLSMVEIENVDYAFGHMFIFLFKAEFGGKAYDDILSALVLTLDDLKKKSPEQQFFIIADRLDLIDNEIIKISLSQKIFGVYGSEIIAMFVNYKNLTHKRRSNHD